MDLDEVLETVYILAQVVCKRVYTYAKIHQADLLRFCTIQDEYTSFKKCKK